MNLWPFLSIPLLAAATAAGAQGLPANNAPALFQAAYTVVDPADDVGAPRLKPNDEPVQLDIPLPLRMQQGVRSDAVRALQVRLRKARVLPTYDVDGTFGPQTAAAVRDFQKKNGLPASGVVDRATWNALAAQTPTPTRAELSNADIGPWFVSPARQGFMMELQHRLQQAGVYDGAINGRHDGATRAAIAVYRQRAGLPAGDVMDERAWTRLIASTHYAPYSTLFDGPPPSGDAQQTLDARCLQGRVVCISKHDKMLSYVVDGQVRLTRAARFAMPGYDSPVGEFRVWYKNRDTVSKIFGERFPMPYAFFYEGNVAVHFSDDFALNGYANGSHGCSQLSDWRAAKWLYEQVKVGDRVVVYE